MTYIRHISSKNGKNGYIESFNGNVRTASFNELKSNGFFYLTHKHANEATAVNQPILTVKSEWNGCGVADDLNRIALVAVERERDNDPAVAARLGGQP